MRVGIANPFAYRPHVAHMVFLDRQFRRLGYETFFLGCWGGQENCSSRVTREGMAHKLECVKCRAGSIRSFLDVPVDRIDRPMPLSEADLEIGRQASFSTACTALQVEHASETAQSDFAAAQRSLTSSTARAYVNARRWIRDNRLDSVFVFNGRFDMTRAILEACRTEGVRVVSVERSWFGEGLQLLPNENCLGLENFSRLSAHWAEKPLTREQALRASGIIARRVARASRGEWRQYNLGTNAGYERGSIKYLFLPSSQHEWLGEPDRSHGWHHTVEGLEYLFGRLGLSLKDLVVRGHPGWAMKIKNYGVNRANGFYRDWTRKVGAEYLEPATPVDTHLLMRSSGVVFLNGSSASMEAAWLGRPVVSFVPAAFTTSGLSLNLFEATDVDRLSEADADLLRRPLVHPFDRARQCSLALRFIFCANYRIMQFVDSMKSDNPFTFRAVDPPDLSGLRSLAERGVLQEHDASFAADAVDESRVVASILSGDGGSIGAEPEAPIGEAFVPVKRRSVYGLVDLLSR